ncbi:MAG: thermonuclease family protein [Patescibacteria group bacterium]|nr:thermonuclease family protein [Patescibacteria group bacterium]
MKKIMILACFIVLIGASCEVPENSKKPTLNSKDVINNNKETFTETPIMVVANTTEQTEITTSETYKVTRVVDGDTFKIMYNGKEESVRLLGIDTPETVDPRKPMQCFGKEASNKMKNLVEGKIVRLESDETNDDKDKYDRLLRYAYLEDETFVNAEMVKQGYAYAYLTYPFIYSKDFKEYENQARTQKLGLWADGVCPDEITTQTTNQPVQTETKITIEEKPVLVPAPVVAPIVSVIKPEPTPTPVVNTPTSCVIKGNISSKGEKIYHVLGCVSYNATKIDESKGEKWFCTEQDALSAGWRKALNCN